MMKKTIGMLLMGLLLFSAFPVALAAQAAQEPTNVGIQEVTNLAASNAGKDYQKTLKTIERFKKIIDSSNKIIEALSRDGYEVSELRNIVGEMTSIKDSLNPQLTRQENIKNIEAFKTEVKEFRTAVEKINGEREYLRHRSVIIDRFERIADNAEKTAELLRKENNVEALDNIIAQMRDVTSKIANSESRGEILDSVAEFNSLIKEFKAQAHLLTEDRIPLRAR